MRDRTLNLNLPQPLSLDLWNRGRGDEEVPERLMEAGEHGRNLVAD